MNGSVEHRHQVFITDGARTEIDTYRRYYLPEELREIFNALGYDTVLFSSGYGLTRSLGMNEADLQENYTLTAFRL